jgi:hypothetical protein
VCHTSHVPAANQHAHPWGHDITTSDRRSSKCLQDNATGHVHIHCLRGLITASQSSILEPCWPYEICGRDQAGCANLGPCGKIMWQTPAVLIPAQTHHDQGLVLERHQLCPTWTVGSAGVVSLSSCSKDRPPRAPSPSLGIALALSPFPLLPLLPLSMPQAAPLWLATFGDGRVTALASAYSESSSSSTLEYLVHGRNPQLP